MRSSKKRSLSHQDIRTLAVVCGSVAFLIAIAAWIAPNSDLFISKAAPTYLVAATDLAIDQGVPSFSRVAPYQRITTPGNPMPLRCYAYNLSTEATRNSEGTPDCNASGANLSVFSVHRKGVSTGQSTIWYASSPGLIYSPYWGGPAIQYATANRGSAVSVPLGSTLTLEWACQPQQTLQQTYCSTWIGCFNKVDKYWTMPIYGSATKTFTSGTALYGSVDVKPTAQGTFTYSLTCNASGGWIASHKSTLTVKVTAPVTVAKPTVGITADSRSLTVGQSTTVRATFAAASGDTLLRTAINDASNNLVAGLAWTPPTNKNWTFRPTAPGTYTFSPAVQTQTYPAWDDYNKSVSITVGCPTGQTNQGGSCTPTPCPTGQQRVNGVCVPITCPTGQHLVGNTCVPTTCPTGQQLVGNVCQPITCPTGQHLVGNTCVPNVVDSCLNMPGVQSGVPANCTQQALPGGGADCVPISSAYIISGASCVPRGVINSFTINPTRVRAGESVTLTWNVSNMTSCGITTTNGVVITPNSAANGSNGSHSVSSTLSKVTRFVLSCADSSATYVREVQGDIIPVVQEI